MHKISLKKIKRKDNFIAKKTPHTQYHKLSHNYIAKYLAPLTFNLRLAETQNRNKKSYFMILGDDLATEVSGQALKFRKVYFTHNQ